MSDVLETKAGFAAYLYPWPRTVRDIPVCTEHDPDLWFPDDKDDYSEAIALCQTCPLQTLCREIAATRGETGIWGGILFKNGRVLGTFPAPGRPRKPTKQCATAA